MKAVIFNIQKFSIHDGPGIRTVVFFKGCYLKCKWCCNPEAQDRLSQLSFDKSKCTGCKACVNTCAHGALTLQDGIILNDANKCAHCYACLNACLNYAISFLGKHYTVEEVLAEVLKDKAFYDKSGGGVTLSGGEVFLQADFAQALCEKLHHEKISVAVETSLAVSPQIFEKLASQIDVWLVDLKHHNSAKHLQGTRLTNEHTLANIKRLVERKANLIVRIAVIKDYNDSLEDAKKFAVLLNELGVRKVELLPFHQLGEKKYERLNMPYAFKGVPGLENDDLLEFAQTLQNANLQAQIGG